MSHRVPSRMGYRVAWVAYTVPHDACRPIWHSDHPWATPEGRSTHHPLQHYQPSFKIQHLPYRPMWLLACFVELAQYLTNDALKVPRTTRCNTSPLAATPHTTRCNTPASVEHRIQRVATRLPSAHTTRRIVAGIPLRANRRAQGCGGPSRKACGHR
jgi:hypothetical protein